MLSFVDEEAWEDRFLLSSVSNGFSCSSNVSMSLSPCLSALFVSGRLDGGCCGKGVKCTKGGARGTIGARFLHHVSASR